MHCAKETNVICLSKVKFALPPGSACVISSYTCRYTGFAASVLLVRAVNPTDLEHIIHIMRVQVLTHHMHWKYTQTSLRKSQAGKWERLLICHVELEPWFWKWQIMINSQNLLWTTAKCTRCDLHCQHASICFWKDNLRLPFLSL